MSEKFSTIFRATVLAMMATPAGAATFDRIQTGYPTLSLTPSQTTVNVGDTFTVELLISGLADTGIPGLSSFDIGVGWFPESFSFEGYVLGTVIGDPELGESADTSTGPVGQNGFQFGQSSNLSADYLTTQLPNSFVLVALEFTALAVTPACNCILISAVPELFDGFGNSFSMNVINEGVNVAVVPLPAAVWLFLAGLAALPGRLGVRPQPGLALPN